MHTFFLNLLFFRKRRFKGVACFSECFLLIRLRKPWMAVLFELFELSFLAFFLSMSMYGIICAYVYLGTTLLYVEMIA